ncbi:adenosine receptor A2a-like [Saccoglossus kowalevskii]|uniref:Adenosine receptor A2a-like n=1 Tax=Saccoglossus kowalevskii TaxID=10224 RepID=A0ABM0MSS3_SACKO|nr:PREDICTED: adenosine receptor A2a-like [Saccoglossus kowalevskii]
MATDVFYLVTEITIAVLAVFGNGLVMWVIFKYKRMQTITNLFILSLAVADFLVGLLAIPFAIMTSRGIPSNFQGCLFMLSFLLWLCTSSTYSLIGVSVDRYLAIAHSLRYHTIMTTKSAVVMITISWLVAGIIGTLPLMGWNKGRPSEPQCLFMEVIHMEYMFFNFIFAILVPLVVMLVIYGSIYHAAKKQIRSIAALEVGLPQTNSRRRTKKELKAVKSLAVIFIVFMVCWFPIYILNTIFLFCPTGCDVPLELLLFAILLSHSNSAVNPFLYGFGRDFRTAYRRAFVTLFPCAKDACHGPGIARDRENSITMSVIDRIPTSPTYVNGNIETANS